QKATSIYENELNNRKVPVIAFGTVELSTEGFSEEYTRKIIAMYKKPIQKQVNKANSQIKSIKQNMSLPDYFGLLIIANNKNMALSPWHIHSIIDELMRQTTMFSTINAAVIIPANLPTIHTPTNTEMGAWIEIRRL